MPGVRVLAQAARELRELRELEEATKWYEAEYVGLGSRLLDEFQRAVQLLREDLPPLLPVHGDAGRNGAKRLLLHRFPFSIVIVQSSSEIVIIAVAHQSRRPGYWSERLGT